MDNLSPDDSCAVIEKALTDIHLIRSPVNHGFGAGVNAGVVGSDGEILLILNPDTYFLRHSVGEAIDLIERDPMIGIVGLDLINPDGSRQYSSRRFYSWFDIAARRTAAGRLWPISQMMDRHLMRSSWEDGGAFTAEWVMGTGFLISRRVFQQIGGMDQGYFLYMEDVDLCARVWQAGYSILGLPGAELVHDHQRSSAQNPLSPAGRAHFKSLLRFRRKFGLPAFRSPGIEGIRRRRPVDIQAHT